MDYQCKSLVIGMLTLSLLAARVQGQVPAVPAAPAAPVAPAVPGAPTSLPSGNIWSKICLTDEQKEKCKKHFCKSIFGKMLGAMFAPLSVYTGGNLNSCCPTPDQANPDDLKKPADSAAGAAARIKQDEAEAKERRADVRYLGTVDCKRYPEAEKALINALRSDRNECVRWEAAIALGSGCCCTAATVEALRLTASGSDKDGNPIEKSVRVRHAAIAALARCEPDVPIPTPEPPERPGPPPPNPNRPPELPGGVTQSAPLLSPEAVPPLPPIIAAQFAGTKTEVPPLPPEIAAKYSTPPMPPRAQANVLPMSSVAANPERRFTNGQRGLISILTRQPPRSQEPPLP